MQARATLMDLALVLRDAKPAAQPNDEVIGALSDDLNTPSAISIVHGLAKSAQRNAESAGQLRATLEFMGLYGGESRDELDPGYVPQTVDRARVRQLIEARLEARRNKDFKESDRIRDELAAMGVALKDAKDPKTGEIVTNWELKR